METKVHAVSVTQAPQIELKVCGWCGLVLAGSPDPRPATVTHGICAKCSDEVFLEGVRTWFGRQS